MNDSLNLPAFKCHKEVRAAKITHVEPSGGGADLFLDLPGKPSVHVDDAWLAKHSPVAHGYFVAYGDGYTSFSPADAFETGYSAIPVAPSLGNAKDALLLRLETDFTYHAPKPGQPEQYQVIRETAKKAARVMVENCPIGRELSTAITHIETAVFFANAAIARS